MQSLLTDQQIYRAFQLGAIREAAVKNKGGGAISTAYLF